MASAAKMSARPEKLPAEILLKIFSYCSYSALVTCIPFVCRWWQEVWKDRTLWRCIVYRPICDRARIKYLLKLSPQFHAIDLSSCDLDFSIVETMVQCCQDIHQLCMPMHAFWDYVKSKDTPIFSNIKVLILTLEQHSSNDLEYLGDNLPNLEHLEFQSHFCTKADLIYFLEKKKHKLRTLGLYCITSDGYCVLPLLSVCTNLNTLSLREFCGNVRNRHLESVLQLRNVSSLALQYSSGFFFWGRVPTFTFFPNIVELQLYDYTVVGGDPFRVVAVNCPLLRKLSFHRSSSLQDRSLGNLHYFQKLTSVSILNNHCITDWGMQQLETVPELTYLDVYDCSKLTVECLKIICNFRNLQVLKFDLGHWDSPIDLKAGGDRSLQLNVSDIKNRALHLMFYRWRDLTTFDHLRKENIRVTMLEDKEETLGKSLLL
ncbi:F-box/LRR-repeat protein fbxl-1 [Anabrus simplex]|uniref:F-box/LRR-repeat protein fbxl-1 n=1 Tax=Anabrus simplex TaxID=316456 RepID=UPI0035A36146